MGVAPSASAPSDVVISPQRRPCSIAYLLERRRTMMLELLESARDVNDEVDEMIRGSKMWEFVEDKEEEEWPRSGTDRSRNQGGRGAGREGRRRSKGGGKESGNGRGVGWSGVEGAKDSRLSEKVVWKTGSGLRKRKKWWKRSWRKKMEERNNSNRGDRWSWSHYGRCRSSMEWRRGRGRRSSLDRSHWRDRRSSVERGEWRNHGSSLDLRRGRGHRSRKVGDDRRSPWSSLDLRRERDRWSSGEDGFRDRRSSVERDYCRNRGSSMQLGRDHNRRSSPERMDWGGCCSSIEMRRGFDRRSSPQRSDWGSGERRDWRERRSSAEGTEDRGWRSKERSEYPDRRLLRSGSGSEKRTHHGHRSSEERSYHLYARPLSRAEVRWSGEESGYRSNVGRKDRKEPGRRSSVDGNLLWEGWRSRSNTRVGDGEMEAGHISSERSKPWWKW